MSNLDYREKIAAAIRSELGGTHQAIKTSMKWTRVSERTAKNWLCGANGPSGEHLVELMRHSDEVTRAVLKLSGRNGDCVLLDLLKIREDMIKVISTIDGEVDAETKVE